MAEQEGFRKCKGMCRPDIYSEAGNRELSDQLHQQSLAVLDSGKRMESSRITAT